MTEDLTGQAFRALLRGAYDLRFTGKLAPQLEAPLRNPQLDWEDLVRRVIANEVVGLMGQVASANDSAFPDDVASALDTVLRRQSERNAKLLAGFAEIEAALRTRGIESIPLKGPELSRAAFGDPGIRTSYDIDFLVKPDNWQATRQTLIDRGFLPDHDLRGRRERAYLRLLGQQVFRRDSDGLMTEPHVALAGLNSFRVPYCEIWRDSRILSEGRRRLSLLDELLLLALHGAKSGWGKAKWATDFAFFRAAHPDLEWQAVRQRARSFGLIRALDSAVFAARRYLPVDAPSPFEVSTPKALLRILPEHEEAAAPARGDLTRERLRRDYEVWLCERMWGRVSLRTRRALHPTDWTLTRYALPEVLYPLYVPLKLGIDAWGWVQRARSVG